jgi:hypothetical protein
MLWQSAGYEAPPAIEVMVGEYFDWLLQQS